MTWVERLVYLIPGVIVALTFHEYAHAAVAYYCGDDTAKRMGRLTLNPLAHLDPIGTMLLLFAGFGWAKPVPVNPMNLTNPKRDMVWVSLAGPASNMILAFIIAIIFQSLHHLKINILTLNTMLFLAFQINLVLAAFNLIPIPPLDGSKIAMGLLPYDKAVKFQEFTRHGPMILMGVLILGSATNVSIISMIISPWIDFWTGLLLGM